MAKQIGLILVHGIGEQGRFEHLDGHIRGIIAGIRRTGAELSVEIVGGNAASFQATQESWRAGPHASLRLVVRGGADGDTDIHVHEVWWADVNERYSLMKQVRFWLWGLAVWAYPGAPKTALPTGSSMFPPRSDRPWSKAFWVRIRLFAVGCFFLVSSLTIGILTVILKRVFNFEAFDIVKIFANYLSSIKLYNQHHRAGTGFSGSGADFLDAIGEPPRVSIRRRMIRTIADVALRKYDRWYIFAHSQGAVVAFNGLMEPAIGWPGYVDERRWKRLRAHGLAGRSVGNPVDMKDAVPAWPMWVPTGEIAYRSRIFANFGGLLTYGCPLEKFAAIWPARVPVCREQAFKADVQWLNAFDPVDPVSGVMKSWPTNDPKFCPSPTRIGYAASGVLLWGHLKYLQCPAPVKGAIGVGAGDQRLADGAARWVLTGDPSGIVKPTGRRFFEPESPRAWRRLASAWIQWFAAFALLSMAGAWVVPRISAPVVHWIAEAIRCLMGPVAAPLPNGLDGNCQLNWRCVLGLVVGSAVVTLAAGIVARIWAGVSVEQSPEPVAFSGVPSPEP